MKDPKTPPAASQDAPVEDSHAPRALTLVENIVLTLKVLVGLGMLGAALWAVNAWKAAN